MKNNNSITISCSNGNQVETSLDNFLSILCLAHDAEYSLFDNQESDILDEISRIEKAIKKRKRGESGIITYYDS